uniref:NR LBD domain-containing protein n=1 Tax=Panagrolaimus sp. ES5 TaxID=591445 RepID=A0AC34FH60_9BILA
MATFFPHLYEYSQLVKSIKDDENKKKSNASSNNSDSRPNDNIRGKSKQNLPVIPLQHKTLTFEQYYQSKNLKTLMYIEEKFQRLRDSSYNPIELYNAKLDILLKNQNELSNVERYQKPKEWPLQNQMKFPESGKHWMVCDAILCIEFAKTLPFFDKLIVGDQLEVLKSTALFNTLLTSAYYSSELNSNVLIYPDGHMPIKYPLIHKTHFDLYERIVEPVKRIKMTKEEFILLKIIILCSTNSDCISDEGKSILGAEKNRYNKLLLEYLQIKHGKCPGAIRYSQIISIMEAIIYFAQKSREFYLCSKTWGESLRDLWYKHPIGQLFDPSKTTEEKILSLGLTVSAVAVMLTIPIAAPATFVTSAGATSTIMVAKLGVKTAACGAAYIIPGFGQAAPIICAAA